MNNLREVASRFALEDAENDDTVDSTLRFEEYIRTMSSLLTRPAGCRLSLYTLLNPDCYTRVLLIWDLVAFAACLGKLSTIVELVKRHPPICGDLTLPFIHGAIGDNPDVIDYLLPVYVDEREAQRKMLIKASRAGKAKNVEHLLEMKSWNPDPPLWIEHDNRKFQSFRDPLGTPSLEVFDILMRDKQKSEYKHLSKHHLFCLLGDAADGGWEEMTAHLLKLGAPTDWTDNDEYPSLLRASGYGDWSPLTRACGYGSDAVVRLLLHNNAMITGYEIEYAARKGRMSTVRILLGHGANANGRWASPSRNSDKPRDGAPIVSAVRLEHEEMFRLLARHGADLESHDHVATQVAQEDGLESMLNLLKEYRVQRQHSRKRKEMMDSTES